jgi:diguanylate cyclase (GGDEF)-like protein/PAS domain S-box-containing protein
LIERSRAASKLAQIATIVENSNDALVGRNLDGRVFIWNAAAERLLGWTAAEAIGKNLRKMFPPEELEQIAANRKKVYQGGMITHESVRISKDGRRIDVSLSTSPIKDNLGNIIGSATIFRDLTERKRTEEHIRHIASYDELTGLPNRRMFHEHLSHALVQAQRNSKPLVVMFIDLDRFKNVNDTLGHAAGDLVLTDVAKRLRGCLRDSDHVGRLGGDEFVVLIEELPQLANANRVAMKILETVAKPFVVSGREFHLGASIGISTFPEDGRDLPNLLKNADIAMYRAKEQGKNNYQYYSAQMNIRALERLEMESDLRRALERNEFLLHYQPKINIASEKITSMEVLVRWKHPTKGLIQPAEFIQLAEETGLIVPLGHWVLKTACAQNRSWQLQGLPPLRLAVNLSARQFSHAGILQDIANVLTETGLDPATLELEITESMVMKDPDHAVALLNKIKAMGIHLSIDDFGTGYSSLSQLKRFPIDSLKIDRSFIHDLPGGADDSAITKAILAMAHSLKLNVIAEGVETTEQLHFLRSNDCDELQGYYFSKPVPEDEFARLVLSQRDA